jgi:hypothetical protein
MKDRLIIYCSHRKTPQNSSHSISATTSTIPTNKANSSTDFTQMAKEDGSQAKYDGNLTHWSQIFDGGSSVGVGQKYSRNIGGPIL